MHWCSSLMPVLHPWTTSLIHKQAQLQTEPESPLQRDSGQGMMEKQNKITPKLLHPILFYLYPWNSIKSFGSRSNMVCNSKKHSFISKLMLTIIFHKPLLSNLEKAWAKSNFFPFLFFLLCFWQNQEIPSHNTATSIYFLTWDSGSACEVKKGEKSLWRNEQKAAGWGLQSKFLCWQKCSLFQMVGEGSWLCSCGKNCTAKYLPGASSLLLCTIVLPSPTPCCLAQKLHFQDKLAI